MHVTKYETNFNKQIYFNQTHPKIKKYPKRFEEKIIKIYPKISYQQIVGFGGAVTEAAGYSFSKLSQEKQENLIHDYFSKDGLNYTLARVPIGSCDFSLKPYSYTSKRNLSDFSIEKDKQYIIPMLQKAKSIEQDLSLFASPWSPPWFMKNTRLQILGGKLHLKYRQAWADYIVKFINAYKNEGLNVKYLTIQNEPNAIQIWESCLYSAKEEADFAINYLYPTFKNNNIDTKIFIWDHNKDRIFDRATESFSLDGSNEAISGIAYHYYSGDHFENLKLVKENFPDKLLIHSEGCTGYSDFRPSDEIQNVEIYAHDILGDLNSGSNGYIDWNILLDHQGGPNHKKNYCNSPCMLNEDSSDYIKNLTYYYIGHFSKFIKVGAKRIAFSKYTDKVEVTSFKNPDDSIAVVILNKNDFAVEYNLCFEDKLINDTIESHSIVTLEIGTVLFSNRGNWRGNWDGSLFHI